MRFSVIVGILAIFMLASISHAENCDAILGYWLDSKKNYQIEIYKQEGKYAGKIVWLKEPYYEPNDPESCMGGRLRLDRQNPDVSRKDRPLLGLEVMWNFIYSGKNQWESGIIYNPVEGRTYRGKITLDSSNILRIRGFYGFSIFGKTQILTKINPSIFRN
jgi:uncharacterized protein (DUF2147 family)